MSGRLWLMNIRFVLCCVIIVLSIVSICIDIVMLSVEVGLLVIKRCGLVDIIIVIIMCWFMLFDNLCGYVLVMCVGLWICMVVSVLMICLCSVWLCRFGLCSWNVLFICFVIVIIGFSEYFGFCRIMFIWLLYSCWCLCGDIVSRLWFVKCIVCVD